MRSTKTYLAISGPTQTTRAPVLPTNPARLALFIQNTGANPGLVRFGGPTQGNLSDILFAAGAWIKWDRPDSCPLEAVAVSSAAATAWCIMETTP